MDKKGKIGIVGCGLIGSSWAMLFSSVGYRVDLYDIDQNRLSAALKTISEEQKVLESNKNLKGKLSAAKQFSLLKGVNSLEECVKDAIFVQESVLETLDHKIKVFKELDAVCPPGCILSSSTSCIQPSKFTENLKNRTNCLVSHPVNPPYYVPLIEIIPAPWTNEETVKKTKSLMEEIGQAPIVFKRELPGFGLNRIQYAIINECWNLVADGTLTAPDVDKIMTHGLAYRYAWLGPLTTAHLNAPKGWEDYVQRYGKTIQRVSASFKGIPDFKDHEVQKVVQQLEEFPVEKFEEKKAWRDARLVAISNLKKEWEDKDES